VPMSDLFGKAGMALLADVPLARAYELRVASLLDVIDAYDYEVEFFRRVIAEELDGARRLPGDPGDPRGGRHVRGDLCRRDRRRHALLQPSEAVLVGRVDAQASRVRRDRAARPHHQAGLVMRFVGRGQRFVATTEREIHVRSRATRARPKWRALCEGRRRGHRPALAQSFARV
jgi:hypothetical protein